MKDIGILIIYMLIPLSLLVLAGYMMYVHHPGAGWLIAGAILLAGSVSFKGSEE